AVVGADRAVPALGVLEPEHGLGHTVVVARVQALEGGALDGAGPADVVGPGADGRHLMHVDGNLDGLGHGQAFFLDPLVELGLADGLVERGVRYGASVPVAPRGDTHGVHVDQPALPIPQGLFLLEVGEQSPTSSKGQREGRRSGHTLGHYSAVNSAVTTLPATVSVTVPPVTAIV